MANVSTIVTPDVSTLIDQRVFVEPLGGPQHPQNYLDRFPEEVFNKSIDSHLVRFMYSLLGPAGIGWLRTNYLQARLLFEEYGLETFDLDKLFSNPLKFGRVFEEIYDDDPRGLLFRGAWETIRAKDASYRSRSLDYVNGLRAGNTPLGMHLVARAGLGHDVEVLENYKFFYDQHSDEPLELDYQGKTFLLEELIIKPRRDISQSEIQRILMTGEVTGGSFKLTYNGNSTVVLDYDSDAYTVRVALEAINEIGVGNVEVTGGPLPDKPIDVVFINELAHKDVFQVHASNLLTGTQPQIFVDTIRGGIDGYIGSDLIAPRDQRHLQTALDHLRPQHTVVSFAEGKGVVRRIPWNSTNQSSSYTQVVRYVTGQSGISWPALGTINWIEKGVEHEGQRALNDLQHHYTGFHNISNIYAYTDTEAEDLNYEDAGWFTELATLPRNEHIGPYSAFQRKLFSPLNLNDAGITLTADRALADYAEPLTVSSVAVDGSTSVPLINGIYPVDYQGLPGVPALKYPQDQFWGSIERTDGDDYLEIDFGEVKAINYLTFELVQKPFAIEVAYDVKGIDDGSRNFVPVTPMQHLPFYTTTSYSFGNLNPWLNLEFYFTNRRRQLIYTRYLRIKFTHRFDANSPFIDGENKIAYSAEVKNLRVGRNLV